MLPYNRNLKQPARQLRSNLTDAEGRLWARLRGEQLLGVQFYRYDAAPAHQVRRCQRPAIGAIETEGLLVWR
jgi:very-short-patch-repair endonuclease